MVNKEATVKWITSRKYTPIIIVGIVIAMIIGQGYFWALTVSAKNKDKESWVAMKKYCKAHPENVYLIEAKSFERYTDLVFTRDESNMKFLGAWLVYSPFTYELYEKYNVSDFSELLWESDNTYLAIDTKYQQEWIEKYFNQRFGECE